jgi:hypothetical protein
MRDGYARPAPLACGHDVAKATIRVTLMLTICGFCMTLARAQPIMLGHFNTGGSGGSVQCAVVTVEQVPCRPRPGREACGAALLELRA